MPGEHIAAIFLLGIWDEKLPELKSWAKACHSILTLGLERALFILRLMNLACDNTVEQREKTLMKSRPITGLLQKLGGNSEKVWHPMQNFKSHDHY